MVKHSDLLHAYDLDIGYPGQVRRLPIQTSRPIPTVHRSSGQVRTTYRPYYSEYRPSGVVDTVEGRERIYSRRGYRR